MPRNQLFTVPELLQAIRRQAGNLSQREACRRTGVDKDTWNRWERNRRMPTIGQLKTVAHDLGFTVAFTIRKKAS